ncbi:MAG: sensor histidine kinase, partial [Microcella sp.]
MSTQQAGRAHAPRLDDTDADGRWRRPRPELSELRPDALLALVVGVGGALAVLLYASVGFFDEPPVPWQAAVMIIGFSGPLVFRRLAPITVTLVISAVYIIGVTNKVPEVLFSNIALFAAMYSIGAWSTSRRAALISRTLIVVVMFGWLFYGLTRAAFDTSLAPEDSGIGLIAPGVAAGLIAVVTNILYFAGAWAFGDRAWNAARERAELEARTRELAVERERTAAQAVALDRVRIGRELHDVVAHHVSVMGIQAGAARRALETRGADGGGAAIGSLASIEQSARQAVDELHRLVTTLRDTDAAATDVIGTDARGTAGSAGDGPSTRGTAQLVDLVRELEAAGRPAALHTIGEPAPLSPVVDTTLYRVAQEAVTNALKHAGASARVDLRLRFSPDAVELDVAAPGVGARAAAV